MRLVTNSAVIGLCLAMKIFAFQINTPEPSTAILLGIGLGAIGVAAWRKSRKK